MGSTILVTGGTGTLGRLVVARLRDAGRDVRVLSRQSRDPGAGVPVVTGDLGRGTGVDTAVAGAHTIVHCAGTSKGDELKARNLVAAATDAGVEHVVFISVVGADRIPVTSAVDRAMFGYFASKLAAERVIVESGLPWTTLRATQFHELTMATVRQMTKLPVIPVPAGFQFQPIAATEVASRLVELTLSPPAGLMPDLAGRRAYQMVELIRGYLDVVGKHRLLMRVRFPGGAARAIRAGANLALDRAVGQQSWESFLSERVRSADAR